MKRALRILFAVLFLCSIFTVSGCGSCEPPEGYSDEGDEFTLMATVDYGDERGVVQETFYVVEINEDGDAAVTSPQSGAPQGVIPQGEKSFIVIESQGYQWRVDFYVSCDGHIWVESDDFVPPWQEEA